MCVQGVLQLIQPLHIGGNYYLQELVSHMLQKDPEHRLSAEEYLVKQRAKAFPDIFYTTLKSFEQHFIDAIIPGDDKILQWVQFSGMLTVFVYGTSFRMGV